MPQPRIEGRGVNAGVRLRGPHHPAIFGAKSKSARIILAGNKFGRSQVCWDYGGTFFGSSPEKWREHFLIWRRYHLP